MNQLYTNKIKKILKKDRIFWVTFDRLWELTIENNQQTDVKPLIEMS
jgi:hypothetical protein